MTLQAVEESLRAYLSTDAPRGYPEVLQVIERYTAPWVHGVSAIPVHSLGQRPAELEDRRTTLDYDLYKDRLPHVERIPFLYRMHHLRQLSTVAVTTHFGAQHTRFSHSLGVAAVATGMLTAIQRSDAHPIVQAITELEVTACQLYCLLHDAFHGPFGHTLDIMKDVFDARPVEKLDDKYLREGLRAALSDEPDPIGAQLKAAAQMWVGDRSQDLLQLVLLLSQRNRMERVAPCLLFLRDIVDSIIDADRIDYVIRDGFYLTGNDHRDPIGRLIRAARAVEWVEEGDDQGGSGGAHAAGDVLSRCREGEQGALVPPVRLAFTIDRKPQVEELLGLRREYYTQYYEAPAKLIVDDMICHAVYYVLRNKGIVSRQDDPNAEATRRRILRHILLLTDEDFIPALLELKADLPSYELLLRYRQRRFFRLVGSVGVRLDEVAGIQQLAMGWITAVEEYLQKRATAEGMRYYAQVADEADSDEVVRISREVFGRLESQPPEDLPNAREKVLNFGFQYLTRSNFRARHDFERQVWASLAAMDGVEGQLGVVAADEYGRTQEKERFADYPPLHITTSSFFADLSKDAVRLHSKEGERGEEVLFFDPHTEASFKERVTPKAKDDYPSYPLVVSALPAIVAALGQETIWDAVIDQLMQFEWIWKIKAQQPL